MQKLVAARSRRRLLVLWVGVISLGGLGEAWAEPASAPAGRALRSAAAEILGFITAPRPDRPEPRAQAAAARETAVFTAPSGLTAAGEVAVRWLEDAPLHGVEVRLDPRVSAWREAPEVGARDAIEAALTEALVQLALELPARPNTTPILVGEDGYYVSPDVLWRDGAAIRPPASSDALSADALSPGAPSPGAEASGLHKDGLGAAIIEAARANTLDAWLVARAPSHPEYARLVEAAGRYRALCAAGGFPVVPPVPAKLRGPAWQDEETLRLIQTRLALEGFFHGAPSGAFDDVTTEALSRYRDARALNVKPEYDAEVAGALNVSCQDRLAVLLLNVRRWRHTAQTERTTWLRVNLAAADVHYYRDGELRARHRVVVGSSKAIRNKRLGRKVRRDATPVMHDAVSVIVVNPEWTVPPRIARDKIDRAIAKDPDYLDKNHFRIVSAANGQKLYVQGRGPHNALGQVKLTFPNSESIYLHDTNARQLFRRPVRAYSAGCVRVDDAIGLATAVLGDDYARRGQELNPNHIRHLVNENQRTYWYRLELPVPIYLEYFTASVEDDGTVWFHADIYEYDAETLAALGSGSAAAE